MVRQMHWILLLLLLLLEWLRGCRRGSLAPVGRRAGGMAIGVRAGRILVAEPLSEPTVAEGFSPESGASILAVLMLVGMVIVVVMVMMVVVVAVRRGHREPEVIVLEVQLFLDDLEGVWPAKTQPSRATSLVPKLTCTIRMLSPVSFAKPSRIFRHGLGEMSNDALKARRCCVVRMVRGRFGPRRPSMRVWNMSSQQ
uniref:Uncharacterized protein n=1 Tax=Anopheles atroparvus TaxID=41427 RepID=A0A182J1N7_ANOAO